MAGEGCSFCEIILIGNRRESIIRRIPGLSVPRVCSHRLESHSSICFNRSLFSSSIICHFTCSPCNPTRSLFRSISSLILEATRCSCQIKCRCFFGESTLTREHLAYLLLAGKWALAHVFCVCDLVNFLFLLTFHAK